MDTKPYSTTKLNRPFTADELAVREQAMRCTCRYEYAYACWGCRERNRMKYRGHIPFYVDGKEVID
jgi:hypothetical protein